MAEGFLLGKAALEQIAKMIREDRARYANPVGNRGRWQDHSTPNCANRYDLRIHWKPTAGTVVIAVTQFDTATSLDVTENITLQWNSTAAQAKTAIELHSVYVAESLTCDCEHGPFPSSNMLIKLAAGGTMRIVSEGLTRGTAAPYPEFRVDKCCLR